MRTRIFSVAAVVFCSLICTIARGQPTPGAFRTREEHFVCAEELAVPTEIPLPNPIGCASRCCPGCPPGPPSWRLHVAPDVKAVVLRFSSLPPGARKLVGVQGKATWERDGRLRVPPGETVLRGFRPDKDGRWPTAIATVEPIVDSASAEGGATPLEGSSGRRLANVRFGESDSQPVMSVQYLDGSRIVGIREISLVNKPCRVGSGAGPPANRWIASANHGFISNPSVTVYDALANGDAPPIRKIQGPGTQLRDPVAIAADRAGRLYVLNRVLEEDPRTGDLKGGLPTVTVYDAGADGNATPIRAIRSPALQSRVAQALAVDNGGAIYVATLTLPRLGSVIGGPGSIVAFPPLANGSAMPTQVIADGAEVPLGIALDPTGSKLYVANEPFWGAGEVVILEKDSTGQFHRTDTVRPSEQSDWWAIGVSPQGDVWVHSELPGFLNHLFHPFYRTFLFKPTPSGSLVDSGYRETKPGFGIGLSGAYMYIADGGSIWVFRISGGPFGPVARIRGASTLLGSGNAVTAFP